VNKPNVRCGRVCAFFYARSQNCEKRLIASPDGRTDRYEEAD
jgi:hypothetical protein